MVRGYSGAVGRRRTKTTEQVAEIAQEDWLPLGPVAAWPTVSAASPRGSRRGQRQRQRQRKRQGADSRGGQTHTAEVDAPWARRCDGGCASEARRRGGESRPSAQGPRLSASLSAAQQRLAAWPSASQRVPACASMCQPGPAASAAVSVVSQFARRAPARESRPRV
jgi:hypothetical protein